MYSTFFVHFLSFLNLKYFIKSTLFLNRLHTLLYIKHIKISELLCIRLCSYEKVYTLIVYLHRIKCFLINFDLTHRTCDILSADSVLFQQYKSKSRPFLPPVTDYQQKGNDKINTRCYYYSCDMLSTGSLNLKKWINRFYNSTNHSLKRPTPLELCLWKVPSRTCF